MNLKPRNSNPYKQECGIGLCMTETIPFSLFLGSTSMEINVLMYRIVKFLTLLIRRASESAVYQQPSMHSELHVKWRSCAALEGKTALKEWLLTSFNNSTTRLTPGLIMPPDCPSTLSLILNKLLTSTQLWYGEMQGSLIKPICSTRKISQTTETCSQVVASFMCCLWV